MQICRAQQGISNFLSLYHEQINVTTSLSWLDGLVSLFEDQPLNGGSGSMITC
jgi:hypothetical protein